MDKRQKEALDRLEKVGYLPQLRKLANSLCAPFWWHGVDEQGKYRILQNGTICFIHTGERIIGVTADHVYGKYLEDRDRYESFGCQIGGSTVEPDRWLISRDGRLDLATFEIPEVLMAPAGYAVHHPVSWPTRPVKEREVVLFGGYPGILREEKTS